MHNYMVRTLLFLPDITPSRSGKMVVPDTLSVKLTASFSTTSPHTLTTSPSNTLAGEASRDIRNEGTGENKYYVRL